MNYKIIGRYDVTRVIKEYPKKQAMINAAISDVIYKSKGEVCRSPSPSSPTQSKAMQIYSDKYIQRLEQELEAVDFAIQELRKLHDWETAYTVIDMLYFRQTHTVDGVVQALNISQRKTEKIIKAFRENVATKLGRVQYFVTK